MRNKAIISVTLGLLLSGCATQEQTLEPEFFIKFDEGSNKLNNVFTVKDKFTDIQKQNVSDKEPVYVLVASGNTDTEFNLALERGQAISKAIDHNVRILVKKLERSEQSDLIAVHAVSDWNQPIRKVFESQDYTESVALDAVLSAESKRYYYRLPNTKSYVFKSKTADKQLLEFAKKIGWEIDLSQANSKMLSSVDFKSIKTSTLESKASTNEVNLLVNELVDNWLPGHVVSVRGNEQKIVIAEDKMKHDKACFLTGTADCKGNNSTLVSSNVGVAVTTQKPTETDKTEPNVIVNNQVVARLQPKTASIAGNSYQQFKEPIGAVIPKTAAAQKLPIGKHSTAGSTSFADPKAIKTITGQNKQGQYVAYIGQTYRGAINSWFEKAGYPKVAWSVSRILDRQLSQKMKEKMVINGTLIDALDKMSNAVNDNHGVKFYISVDEQNKIGAVHEWPDRPVRIINVRRAPSLEMTIKNLVKDFGWNWDDKYSWKSKKQYSGYPIDFPIVTPADDVQFALNLILTSRPVIAKVHEGTKTVFIYDI